MALIDKSHQAEYWANNPNARRYDHPVVRAFAKQRLDWLDGVVNLASIERALDVGCGDGFATYYMDERVQHVEAGDASELMLKIHPLPAERLHLLNAEDMREFGDKSFDLVYAWEVLHHLTNPRKAIEEMVRISKKYVVIFEPNRDHVLQLLFGLAVKHERGILRSTKEYLVGLTQGLPVRVKEVAYSGRIPPNKTPERLLPYLLSLPFVGGRYDAISVGLVLERVD